MTPRPKQSVPIEIVDDLMGVVRNQFYADASPKVWGQQSHFIRARVVMWPASWLTKRGVTLSPARYKEIVLRVLNEVKIHGQTSQVKFWPGYLLKCLQDHFKHHGEDYYTEAKSARTLAETALLATGATRPNATPTIDPIRALAEARQDLLRAARQRKQSKPTPSQQPELF